MFILTSIGDCATLQRRLLSNTSFTMGTAEKAFGQPA
jgi:hypothetical protein